MKPEWLNDKNGIWTYELNNIHDILAEYIQNWLEDNVNIELYDKGIETSEEYKNRAIPLNLRLLNYLRVTLTLVEKFLRFN